MATFEPTYQYRLTGDECQVLNCLREIEDNATRLFGQEGLPVQEQKMNISFTVRGKSFGIYEVNPTNITREYLRVFRDLLTGRSETQSSGHAPETTTIGSPISLDGGDNAYGSQDSIEESGKKDDLKTPMPWQTFRKETIPSAVRTITFTVHGSDMHATFQEQLQQQFPDVIFTCESSGSSETWHAKIEANKQPENDRSHSVKQQHIDLSRTSILQHEPCDQDIRMAEQTWAEHRAHVEDEHSCKTGNSEQDKVLVAPDGVSEKGVHAETKESSAETSAEYEQDPPLDGQDVRLPEIQDSHSRPTAFLLIGIRTYIKLELLETATPSPIKRMFKQWQDNGELKQWAPRLGDVQQFNSNMIRLYILDYYEKQVPPTPQNASLASAVLLQFQATAYQHGGDIPKLETAAYAFKYLPYFSPLCRWIRLQYAHLWGTQEDLIGHKQMPEKYPELNNMAFTDTKALLDLMYGVTWERDPHTRGHDAAVLSRWCEVHNHADVGEKALCDKMQPHVQAWLKDAEEEQERQRLEEAISEFAKHDNLAAMKKRLEELRTKTTMKKSRKRAENSPVQLAKNSKKTRVKDNNRRSKNSPARHVDGNERTTTKSKKRGGDVSLVQSTKKRKEIITEDRMRAEESSAQPVRKSSHYTPPHLVPCLSDHCNPDHSSCQEELD